MSMFDRIAQLEVDETHLGNPCFLHPVRLDSLCAHSLHTG